MIQTILDVAGFLAVPLLVLMNGFFVAAEFSLVTIRWTRVEELVEQNRFGAIAVRDAVKRIEESIATTQLGITFASLALGWVGEPALAHFFEPMFARLPGHFSEAATHIAAVAVGFLLITYFHVVLGELAPKAIALQRAERVALLTSGPLLAFGRVVRPFISFIKRSGNLVVHMLRLPPLPPESGVHSVDELSMLVEETEEAGVLPSDQATILQNVFELPDKTVRDVMVPREKVVTLSLHAAEDAILEAVRETAHTRMPVWEDHVDDIVGIVNTKDLFHVFTQKGVVILMDAMYPAIFVDPDMAVARLLRRFRRERRQMAVVQERGRFLGIVTLEDIVEEIVGEIEDEHDETPNRGPRPIEP